MVHLQPSDIVLVSGTSWVDDAIEDITRSSYSHCALAVDDTTLIEALWPHKVRFVNAHKYDGDAMVLRYRDISHSKRLEVVARAKQYMGRHYSLYLIFLEFLRYEFGWVPVYRGQDVICSLLVADAFRNAHLDFCGHLPYPSPADVSRDAHVEYVGSY